MVELVGDPLVHLVRNSLDHGIELPAVREQAGKPRCGSIRLEARQEGDQIVISISDDGAGMDPERMAAKLLRKDWLRRRDCVAWVRAKFSISFFFPASAPWKRQQIFPDGA